MGPKKEVGEREKGKTGPSLDDPINSETWKCVVVLGVERSSYDSFILKEFLNEANKEYRQEVKSINFECFVLKILNDFLNGELSFKYVSLLNFSSVLHDAAEFVKSETDIPIPLLVKVIKALLFVLREESIVKIEKKSLGPPDPIRMMAERPGNVLSVADNKMKSNAQKKDVTTAGKSIRADAAGENEIRIKPPSAIKQDTKLLKRGEGAKADHYIDDAPLDGFNLYVLLTGFYHPDFPLELIKADVPLHGLLCIDTSLTSRNRFAPSTHSRLEKFEANSEVIQNFWDAFLKILWDPTFNFYFKDVIFQVYTPQKPICTNTKLSEFIYKELSYLLYDMSDFKRQHENYLSYLKLWNVSMKESDRIEENEDVMSYIENLPSECITVPVVVQHLLDVICFEEEKDFYEPQSDSFDSIDTVESTASKPFLSASILVKHSSSAMTLDWNNIINQSADFNTLSVYTTTKELDIKYAVHDRIYMLDTTSGKIPLEKTGSQTQMCFSQRQSGFGGNLEEVLNPEWSVFKSFWKNIPKEYKPYCLDYSIYLLLMTKVLCSFQVKIPVQNSSYKNSFHSNSSKKKRKYKKIEKVEEEMKNPHFSVTSCSRNVLKLIPYNIKELNRDFFCPSEFKIVSPGKLKAISAPEFRQPPPIDTEISFLSDFIIPDKILQNLEFDVFENLKYFLGEDVFSNLNGFDFVEELSKTKLLMRERELVDEYNCIDHFYSVLTDSVFVVLHNRKDCYNTYHETFNEVLRTAVGLRDFFEYVLDDECSWLETQAKKYQGKLSDIGKNFEQNSDFKNYSDSDFWLDTSIKYQEYLKLASSSQKEMRESKTGRKVSDEIEAKQMKKVSNTGKPPKKINDEGSHEFSLKLEPNFDKADDDKPYAFEGYNVSDVAVQFSGLKTVYHANDSSVAVELIERLYGNQDLGIHVRQGGHTLHLYSYVCPEPHVLDPYTCHLCYKNGIVVAFSKRFVETFDLIEDEIVESKTVVTKSKRNSLEAPTTKKTKIVRKVSKRVEDDRFSYDMTLSMPNGLAIAVVRKIIAPCYIKQWYLTKCHCQEKTLRESKRLFLPNGNVVKIMENGSVEVLGIDASIVTSSLDNLSNNLEEKMEETEYDSVLSFTKYEITTSEGLVEVVDEGKTIFSKRIEVFVNRDVQSSTTFCRRMDGTNYLIQNDGTMCVQFKDGTKMSNCILTKQKENVNHSDLQDVEKISEEKGFTCIYHEIIMEHPDYATVIYNSQEKEWKILLPYDSAIKVASTGNYQVDIDGQTEMKICRNEICMNRFSTEHELLCHTTVDLTVFENEEKQSYCQMKDSSGKIFIVEPNSNCYVLSPEEINESTKEIEGEIWQEGNESSSQSQLVALDDLTSVGARTATTRKEERNKANKLSPDNKYLVVRRDMTGFELLHRGSVVKALKNIKKGSVIFTQEIPGSEKLRFFVLIGPAPKVKSKLRKWEVDSILPEPKFVPGRNKTTTSSIYGNPPSWMHPFPKKRTIFEIPQVLTCRVFIETKRTEFSPQLGSLDSYFSELRDLPEIRHSKIEPGLRNVLDYMKRLSNDDQDMLKEMYALTANQILTMKKKLKPLNTEKLERYLALSKYHTKLQMYHKRSIRYHLVPNYFDHPPGICWLVLNELIMKQRTKRTQVTTVPPVPSPPSIFSNEEIEYNLSLSAKQSFSDLSCRTDITMLTAPMIMTHGGVCRCKIKPVRGATSAPITKMRDSELSELDVKTSHGVCAFREDEIETLQKANDEHEESFPRLTLKDLICLGLV